MLTRDGEAGLLIPDPKFKVFLLYEALRRTPIFKSGQFIAGEEFCQSDLSEFANFIKANNETFEAQFNRSFGATVGINTTKILSDLLGMMYLQLKGKRKAVGDKRIKYYTVDDRKLYGLSTLKRIRSEETILYGDEV